MLVINLKPSDRAIRYCKKDNIELTRVQAVLNFIAQYIDKRKKIEIVNMSLDIDCRKADSEYNFQSKHILIAGITEKHRRGSTREGRLKYLFEHLVHEFRHCMQEVIFHRDASEITYDSTDDAEYADNPLEIDANWFEQKFAKKAYHLYRSLRKAKVKNADVFYE
jgi:hypothetical protein